MRSLDLKENDELCPARREQDRDWASRDAGSYVDSDRAAVGSFALEQYDSRVAVVFSTSECVHRLPHLARA